MIKIIAILVLILVILFSNFSMVDKAKIPTTTKQLISFKFEVFGKV